MSCNTKDRKVYGADWHGKIVTFLLYGTAAVHIIWLHITPMVSDLLIGLCAIMMVVSVVLYIIQNTRTFKEVWSNFTENVCLSFGFIGYLSWCTWRHCHCGTSGWIYWQSFQQEASNRKERSIQFPFKDGFCVIKESRREKFRPAFLYSKIKTDNCLLIIF